MSTSTLTQLLNYVVLKSTETIRLIRDGEKGGGGMAVAEEGDYTPIATLPPPE